jgi:anthranilate synthase component 1
MNQEYLKPNLRTFTEQAKTGNLIPVCIELMADQLTPVSAYAQLRKGCRERLGKPNIFLLESVEGGERLARYSFIVVEPDVLVSARNHQVKLDYPDGRQEVLESEDPLSVVQDLMKAYSPVTIPRLPRFTGGAIGYLGYDSVRYFEKIDIPTAGEPDWPEMIFAISRKVVVFDHVKHSMLLISNAHVEDDVQAAYDQSVEELNTMIRDLSQPAKSEMYYSNSPESNLSVESNTSPEGFKNMVLKAKEYIRAGDVIQTVISQRFRAQVNVDPLSVYRVIRSINPSPYMFNLEFGGRSLVGASPEIHVRCEDGKAELRPIAGTRPRGMDAEQDQRFADELLADPKERAEHIMLVDLGRNDLGRVCTYGSVHVPELMVIEKYSHVMHIVSDVVGELKPDCNAYDLIRATFPAGTLSGAPKIRAMEIISELEQTRRGAYGGAVAYVGFDGTLDSCITIRTLLLDGNQAYVQAGAGIVADSDPESEYQETCNKARSMLKALGIAQNHERHGGETH